MFLLLLAFMKQTLSDSGKAGYPDSGSQQIVVTEKLQSDRAFANSQNTFSVPPLELITLYVLTRTICNISAPYCSITFTKNGHLLPTEDLTI